MIRQALVVSIALGFVTLGVRAQLPSTDIFVVQVDGKSVGAVERITDRAGYDNQPQFLPSGDGLLYTAMGESGTDIQLYDFKSKTRRAVTATPESEYSPTPMPGGGAISVIRDYGELKQQLWSFPLAGGEPRLLLPDVNPVGYHAWVDEHTLLLFVLGEPHTLQTVKVGPGEGQVLADSPGRALARMPGRGEMSFVDKSGDLWWLSAVDVTTGKIRPLASMPEGCEDFAWAPDGSVWVGDGSRLRRWQPDGDGWEVVAELAEAGVQGITRLALSPDGSRLALVSSRP